MPQTLCTSGFEAYYVKWLNLFTIFLFRMGVGLIVGMVGLIEKNFFPTKFGCFKNNNYICKCNPKGK